MSNLLGLKQYWKLPTGFFSNESLPANWHVCDIIENPGLGHDLKRLTLGKNSIFCTVGWSSVPRALQPLVDLRDPKSGKIVATIGKVDGKLYLPFDVQFVIEAFQLDHYIQSRLYAALLQLVRRVYYLLRPLIPRTVQIGFRQSISPLQNKIDFPNWPVDMSLDAFYRMLLILVLKVSEISKVPFIWFWPDGYANAVILTHDVDTQIAHDNVWQTANLEKQYGFRSLWNFVPKRYNVDPMVLANLKADGFEIGVHGLYHDGHLFSSRDVFESRAEQINHYLQVWDSEGFRSPSALRNLSWISEIIHAAYDTSCPMTEIHVPQPGGCCSAFPFIIGQMVELPFTMPQDNTLFTVIKNQDQNTWLDVASQIMNSHGLVNVIVHPCYMLDSAHLSCYESLLQWLKQRSDSWFALPKEVASWWRNRNQQQLSYGVHGWQIKGPEAERARIAYVSVTDQELLIGFE